MKVNENSEVHRLRLQVVRLSVLAAKLASALERAGDMPQREKDELLAEATASNPPTSRVTLAPSR